MRYAVVPCDECPWRTDVKTGRFSPERYVSLAPTAYDLGQTVFACHKSKDETPFACAGFLLMSSAHNLQIRLARQEFKVSSPYPLFNTYRELAVANGVPADHPCLKPCRDDGAIE